jgi:hypothetical protein
MMSQQQLPAILLILGFVLILAASTVGPPKLYQEPDIEKQLENIGNHTTSWTVSNLFYALAGFVTAGGLIIFSLQLRGSGSFWLAGAGSAAYILGAVAYTIFLYRRTVDPAALFTNYTFSPLTVVLLGSMVIGLLLYGVAFLQAGYPGWLGVGMIAGMVLIGGAALVFPAQFFKSFPPQVLYLFTLIAGIVLLLK